jgi:hypothetical protein
MDWSRLLEKTSLLYGSPASAGGKKSEISDVVIELAAETGQLGLMIKIFEDRRLIRHDLSDRLSAILFILCRLNHEDIVSLKGNIPNEYAHSTIEACLRICAEVPQLYKEYKHYDQHRAAISVRIIAGLVFWLFSHYQIDWEYSFTEEIALTLALRKISFNADGQKKKENFFVKFFYSIKRFFILKKHGKRMRKI